MRRRSAGGILFDENTRHLRGIGAKVSSHRGLNWGQKVKVGRKRGSKLEYTGLAVHGSKLRNPKYRMQQGKSTGACGCKGPCLK